MHVTIRIRVDIDALALAFELIVPLLFIGISLATMTPSHSSAEKIGWSIPHPSVPRFLVPRPTHDDQMSVKRPAAGSRALLGCGPIEHHTLQAMVQKTAMQNDLPPRLLLSMVKRESSGYPCVVSPRGAAGIMQLMPATARALGVLRINDATQNLEGGARYLRRLLNRYNNNLALALAAYNAGPRNVDVSGGIPPFRETQKYVAEILAGMAVDRVEREEVSQLHSRTADYQERTP